MILTQISGNMVKLAGINECTGCTACYAACGRGAISMVPDTEGFLQPVIDEAKCVNCVLCEKACPVLAKLPSRTPIAVYAAKAKDDELRMKSSSGGVFSLLARAVIAEGGVVFGAGFDHGDWHVMHKSAENEEELEDLRGSKYVQSEMGDVFRRVKDELARNRKVLFSGTPCQIAGLSLFLGKPYDNLLLVDVVCHAVPSPLAWRKYLEKRLFAVNESLRSSIKQISFRRKNCGWKRYSLSMNFANGDEYLKDLTQDSFLRGFNSELYNRLSCHNCPSRGLKSGSDLTIADYWRVHEKLPEMDDGRGTSLILVNTAKGNCSLKSIEGMISATTSDFDDAIRVNPSIVKSSSPSKKRSLFFKAVHKSDFDRLVLRLLRRPIWRRGGALVKRMLKKALGK